MDTSSGPRPLRPPREESLRPLQSFLAGSRGGLMWPAEWTSKMATSVCDHPGGCWHSSSGRERGALPPSDRPQPEGGRHAGETGQSTTQLATSLPRCRPQRAVLPTGQARFEWRAQPGARGRRPAGSSERSEPCLRAAKVDARREPSALLDLSTVAEGPPNWWRASEASKNGVQGLESASLVVGHGRRPAMGSRAAARYGLTGAPTTGPAVLRGQCCS